MLVILDVIDNHFIFFCLLLIKGRWPPFLQRCQCCQLTLRQIGKKRKNFVKLIWIAIFQWKLFSRNFCFKEATFTFKECDFTKYFSLSSFKENSWQHCMLSFFVLLRVNLLHQELLWVYVCQTFRFFVELNLMSRFIYNCISFWV